MLTKVFGPFRLICLCLTLFVAPEVFCQDDEPPTVVLAATDPSQEVAVFQQADQSRPHSVVLGGRMTGNGWHGELVHVGLDRVQLDADVETEEGTRRVTLEILRRRAGEEWSAFRAVDLSSKNEDAFARPQIVRSTVVETESAAGQTFRLSQSRGLVPVAGATLGSTPASDSKGASESSLDSPPSDNPKPSPDDPIPKDPSRSGADS